MADKQNSPGQPPGFAIEFVECWKRLPNKGLFLFLTVAWLLFFQFLGNATFGYVNTPSLFHWMYNAYKGNDWEEGHGLLVPVVVLVLFWWKRRELLALPVRVWWPGLIMLAAALALHLVGYLVQQPRLSIVALFGGIYALMGLSWGPRWLWAACFPFFLLAFCVPITSIGEAITFPLRVLMTKIVVVFCNLLLGMDIIRDGTQLFDGSRRYNYNVDTACSGMRSLIAIVALCTIYGFVTFQKTWKRLLMMAVALPLAVLGNSIRLLCIVIAAELSGQSAGNFVHENFFFSLLPYAPVFLGVILLGNWLRERPVAGELPLNPRPV